MSNFMIGTELKVVIHSWKKFFFFSLLSLNCHFFTTINLLNIPMLCAVERRVMTYIEWGIIECVSSVLDPHSLQTLVYVFCHTHFEHYDRERIMAHIMSMGWKSAESILDNLIFVK